MAYRYDKTDQSIVIDGFEKGIASSPYTGISNMRNVGISYYPSVAYVNYKRQACTLAESGTFWYAGAHSINVSDNTGWIFEASPGAAIMTNPIQHATSPSGLNYILDDTGQIWKQSAVNSSTFNLLGDSGRFQNGAGGLAYWNNYLAVIGNGMIEFCGNGTGDAAIISGNWNLTSSPSTVTVVSQLLFMNSFYSSESYAFTATPSSGATSANLNSNWVGVSGTYVVEFNNSNQDHRNVVFTNGAAVVTWSGGLSVNCVDNTFMMYQLRVIDGSSFVGSTLFTAGSAVQFSSSGTLPANISANTTYYLIQTVDLQTDHTFFVAGSTAGYVNNRFITINSAGSGTITMSLLPPTNPPIQNTTITGFTWGTNGSGSTSLTLATLWTYATGIWNIVDTLGNQIQASFVYDSSIVSLINPASYQSAPSGTFQVNILNPSPSTTSQAPYRFWVSKVDGNLYFANGRWVGRVSDSINTNVTFNPSIPSSYSVSYAATGTLQPQDVFVPMSMERLASPFEGGAGPSLLEQPDNWWLEVMGRLKPGVKDSEARALIDVALAAAVRGTMTVKAGDTLPRTVLVDGSRGLHQSDMVKKPLDQVKVVEWALNPEHVKTVVDGMYGVVNEGGTGVRAALPHIEVCGKTGTAQLASYDFMKATGAGAEMKENA